MSEPNAAPGHEDCRFCADCGHALFCPRCDRDGKTCMCFPIAAVAGHPAGQEASGG